MKNRASTLIIPVESQVRELDAKILLSCIAAERGFPVIMGSRAYAHFQVASVPRGIYLAKSMRSLSSSMFKILRQLGHEIVAWEEEALVHPPPETYFSLRLSPMTIKNVSHVFAWGQENVDLLRQYPSLPENMPIHITGNPRGDMLRPEIRPYFASDVEKLRSLYGDFILINTNFSDVNPYIPSVGLFLPTKAPSQSARLGQSGIGMSRQFAEGLREHKLSVLEDFKQLIPMLEQAFPELTIIIRPHPSESYQIYHQIAAKCPRVVITNQGNVIPWLLAAKAMVHNGCTTGLEAYVLGVPAISYLATLNKYYDYDFQGLPTKLSYQCFNFEEMAETLSQILKGEIGAADGQERQDLIDYFLAAKEGSLACERIVDILEASGYSKEQPPAKPIGTYLQGWLFTKLKAGLTNLYMRRPGPNRLAYHNHRFPGISVEEIEQKIARFGELLKRFDKIKVAPYAKHVFRIST
ncbi:surface carbohydrate biosynthesis protein [Nitrosomonas communis]|uniref:Surface carbohydrate biosynthesis protein n=1 Tax=Nitrosomonas communis TaxID=44574 RepID=A0A1I4NZP1_9PROT|nr:surface carbohydrate biosynthesis protein [Nitrosomonas communis]SFM20573.1 surface carbohydrate biosynthesis protein [Nitrosomonas communis]